MGRRDAQLWVTPPERVTAVQRTCCEAALQSEGLNIWLEGELLEHAGLRVHKGRIVRHRLSEIARMTSYELLALGQCVVLNAPECATRPGCLPDILDQRQRVRCESPGREPEVLIDLAADAYLHEAALDSFFGLGEAWSIASIQGAGWSEIYSAPALSLFGLLERHLAVALTDLDGGILHAMARPSESLETLLSSLPDKIRGIGWEVT
jgi:hypothetical protein